MKDSVVPILQLVKNCFIFLNNGPQKIFILDNKIKE